jgi:hypothetical protein
MKPAAVSQPKYYCKEETVSMSVYHQLDEHIDTASISQHNMLWSQDQYQWHKFTAIEKLL